MITTFHELLSHPSPPQRRLIQELARLSCGIVVLTTGAARLLAGAYHVSAVQPVCVILHAMPDAPHEALNHRAERPLGHDSARHEWTPVQALASAKPTLWSQEGAQYWELFDQILATRDKRLGSRFLASFGRPPNKDHG